MGRQKNKSIRRKQDRYSSDPKKGRGNQDEDPIEQTRITRELRALKDMTSGIDQIGKKYRDKISELEIAFKESSPEAQNDYVSETYDLFAPKYINYMESTGHNAAMRKIVDILGRHLSFPLIDVSAGPGVLTEYIIRMFIDSALTRQVSQDLRADPNPSAFSLISLDTLVDKMERLPTTELPKRSEDTPLIVLNDFSSGMIRLAKKRFEDIATRICGPLGGKVKNEVREQIQEFFIKNIIFTKYAIEELPDVFENCFSSVVCSQTMHVTPNKEGVLDAITKILRYGGNLLSIEEFPFRISPTTGFQEIMVRLRATVDPIEGKIKYRDMVEKATEVRKGDGAIKERKRLHYIPTSEVRVWVSDHPMYGFLFTKPGRIPMQKPPKFWLP